MQHLHGSPSVGVLWFKQLLVYALLDTQSDSTFIDTDLKNKLQAQSLPVRIKLITMLGESMVMKSEVVSGLKVRGFNSCEYIDLPPSYTKDSIPANREHIPTRAWQEVKFSLLYCPNPAEKIL